MSAQTLSVHCTYNELKKKSAFRQISKASGSTYKQPNETTDNAKGSGEKGRVSVYGTKKKRKQQNIIIKRK